MSYFCRENIHKKCKDSREIKNYEKIWCLTMCLTSSPKTCEQDIWRLSSELVTTDENELNDFLSAVTPNE